jgi:hypothetical protein
MSLVSLTALRLLTGEAKCLTQMKIFVRLGASLPWAGKVLPSGRCLLFSLLC